jgi:peptidoglycan/LPS O-acetylase OafA/YrhL
MLQQQLTEIGFASVYVVDWNLAINAVDYLPSGNVASVAQHYWSLSVDEQFYVAWPLLVMLCVWFAAHSRLLTARKMVLLALTAIFVISFLFSIYETARAQPAAHFMTTTKGMGIRRGRDCQYRAVRIFLARLGRFGSENRRVSAHRCVRFYHHKRYQLPRLDRYSARRRHSDSTLGWHERTAASVS